MHDDAVRTLRRKFKAGKATAHQLSEIYHWEYKRMRDMLTGQTYVRVARFSENEQAMIDQGLKTAEEIENV